MAVVIQRKQIINDDDRNAAAKEIIEFRLLINPVPVPGGDEEVLGLLVLRSCFPRSVMISNRQLCGDGSIAVMVDKLEN